MTSLLINSKGMKNFAVGIDISKKTFDASIVSREKLSKVIVYRKFSNNADGFCEFTKWVEDACGADSRENVLMCAENTGVYGEPLAAAMSGDGWTIWIESPLQIKRSLGISRGKDDKQDSRKIAEYAARHEDKAIAYTAPSESVETLHVLFSQRRSYIELRDKTRRRLSETKEKCAANRILSKSAQRDKDLIEHLNGQIAEIEAQMRELVNSDESISKTYKILTSMKGIALVNAVALIVYTNNFTRFDYDARKICSYWGVAPFAHQSGTSVNGTPHVSVFADTYLKSLLSEAVLCAQRYCPAIMAYSTRLKKKGKHPSIIKNNCKNKMLHILVAMVKNGTLYGEYAPVHEKITQNVCILT